MHHFPAGRARELCQVHRQLAQGNNSSTNTALPRGRGKALTFSCWRSRAWKGGVVFGVGHPAADPLGAEHLPHLFRHPRSSLPAPSSKHTRQYHFHKGLCSLQPALETAPYLWEDVSCASQFIDEETAALRYYNLLQVAQEDRVNT